MLNLVTIYAITKTSSLPKPLKTLLLLSLAVSDLDVGLLVQPFYIALMINQLQGNNRSCTTSTAFAILMSMFSFTSFLGVMSLIVDRFLAIHLHLRYQELVTHKRVIAVVVSLIVIYVASMISGSSVATKNLTFYGMSLIFLNSSLNPLIYCWKMRHIRSAVMNILRKVLTC